MSHAGLAGLVDPGAEPKLLGTGFVITEGPVWSPSEECLYFSDIPADTRWRWTESGGMEAVLRPTFKANGLVMDAAGNLLACEHVASSVSRYDRDGRREVLAYHTGGVYLNSPNDLVTRAADGSVYFTDPDFGRWDDHIGAQRTKELGYRGVLRVPGEGGGEAELLVDKDEFDQPNGLCFSPDESLLYVNDSPREHVKVFDVAADGTLSNGRVFHEGIGVEGDMMKGTVDGMRCDVHGNLWVTGPGGVWVITHDGEHLGTLEVPELTLNLVWGGRDWRTLFLTCLTSVYAVETLVAPARLPYHTA